MGPAAGARAQNAVSRGRCYDGAAISGSIEGPRHAHGRRAGDYAHEGASMNVEWGYGWANWASEAVLWAWIAAGVCVWGLALFTNRIKRRDAPRGRLLDFTL